MGGKTGMVSGTEFKVWCVFGERVWSRTSARRVEVALAEVLAACMEENLDTELGQ